MITKEKAEEIAKKHINYPLNEIVRFEDKGKVWYITYTIGKEQDIRARYGNLPFIIDKSDGELHTLPNPLILFFNSELWEPVKQEKISAEQRINIFVDECIEEYLDKKYK